MIPTAQPAITRKLIEVSLPLEDINRESAREKSIRHGHPSTLHLWWARRPLAAARAVLFAQLVDDPSSHPDQFPTEEDQRVERERLHDIIRRLVVWENLGDEGLMREAHEEILRSTGGNPPAILDPFAGGGTIPLEAQRLGLEAHASDLNPVAVLITKALIEIPPTFAGRPPVFPGAADSKMGDWQRATGLAEDVRRYGAWMRERAEQSIGHLYPTAKLPDGSEATVIAWIWTRTVKCPNPACGIETPLVRSWWLGKKKGKEAYVVPELVPDADAPSSHRVAFTIGHGAAGAPGKDDGTVGRKGATCVACRTTIDLKYIRVEGVAGRMGVRLMAAVAEGRRERVYLAPTEEHVSAADVPRPEDVPLETLSTHPQYMGTPRYGLTRWAHLFTNRQLTALMTFSGLVSETREQVLTDALTAGMADNPRCDPGATAQAYADAVTTYLGLVVGKLADLNCNVTTWKVDAECPVHPFTRPALPMTWDFPETNPLSASSGSWVSVLRNETAGLLSVQTPSFAVPGAVSQADAASRSYAGGVVLSTDPPYYDNVPYAELSDFFYVWLRRSMREVYPSLFSTVLVPKSEELVANTQRHGGTDEASQFFQAGFEHVFSRARRSATDAFPITVYYAFKQQELESEGVASTGWATMLEGMIRAGWTITATWPVRSELSNRMRNIGSNALASSIVLALRPRYETAETTSRRGFLAALKSELPRDLRELQQGAIAPVDLAQATIGPGMAIFSRYNRVMEADGSAMSVKTALALINQALDEVLAERDGELDPDSRFCLKWYAQYGWSEQPSGEADVLARAVNTSPSGLVRGGVLYSKAGVTRLFAPGELDPSWDPLADVRISVWEATLHLARVLDADGGAAAASLMARVGQRVELDAVQLLAYRLYELTQATRPADAMLFNGLGTSWSDLTTSARRADTIPKPTQSGFDLDTLTED